MKFSNLTNGPLIPYACCDRCLCKARSLKNYIVEASMNFDWNWQWTRQEWQLVCNNKKWAALSTLPIMIPSTTAGEVKRKSLLEQECLLEPVAEDTCNITYESNPCHVLHVPSERDVLESHNDNACCRTDDEH